jgi:hypothetical protein
MLARLGLVERLTRAPLARRFAMRAAQGPGLLDLVLGVPAIGPVIDAARRMGRTIQGPIPGRRPGPGGAWIAWELGVPEDDELPLLIADVTPRRLRAAPTPESGHANGATGVTDAVLPVRDPAAAAAALRAILDVPSRADGARSLIEIGTTRLVLEPAPGWPSGRPTRLALAGGQPRRLDVRAAHGAVLDLA